MQPEQKEDRPPPARDLTSLLRRKRISHQDLADEAGVTYFHVRYMAHHARVDEQVEYLLRVARRMEDRRNAKSHRYVNNHINVDPILKEKVKKEADKRGIRESDLVQKALEKRHGKED